MANDYKKIIKEKKEEANKLMTPDQVVKCNAIIHGASAATSAEALIPIPGVDAIPMTATQIAMVVALGKVFEQKVTESVAKGMIVAAASTFVGRNLVKLIPIAGMVVSAAVAAGVTEAMGWTIAVDLANNAFKETVSELVKNAPTIKLDDIDDSEDIVQGSTDDEHEDMKRDEICDEENEELGKKEEPHKDDQSISDDFSKCFEEDD